MSTDLANILAYIDSYPQESVNIAHARRQSQGLGVDTISATTGSFLSVLATATQALSVVDISSGTGVSGLYLLQGMPAQGILTCINSNADSLATTRSNFTNAGYANNRTRMMHGDAAQVLPRLRDASYDLVFLNADASQYTHYFQQAVRLLRNGGLILINNALDDGQVANPAARNEPTVSLRRLLKESAENPQLEVSLLPINSGILLAAKHEKPTLPR